MSRISLRITGSIEQKPRAGEKSGLIYASEGAKIIGAAHLEAVRPHSIAIDVNKKTVMEVLNK